MTTRRASVSMVFGVDVVVLVVVFVAVTGARAAVAVRAYGSVR